MPNFRFITLKEPLKKRMVSYLECLHANKSTTDVKPPREARVQVVISPSGVNQLYELIVDLGDGRIIKEEHLIGKHSYIDSAYMQEVEAACMADSQVQAEIEKLKIPDGATVCVEPWAYATDGVEDMSKRTTMVSPLQSCQDIADPGSAVLVLHEADEPP